MTAMAVAVVVEQEKTDNVGKETAGTDDEDNLRMRDVLGLDKALDGFQKDGQTQCDKKDAVDQRTQGFGALPLHVGLASVPRSNDGIDSLRRCKSSSWSSGWLP